MLVLALDTATAATAVAVVTLADDGAVQPLARRRHVDPRAHGEQLAPQMQAVLAEAGAAPDDLSALVAGVGPGPFTGLRVGLATAAAMAQSLNLPTYGVCSLDGIGVRSHATALVATDARRREVYWAIYQDGQRRTGPAVDRPAELPSVCAEHGVTVGYGEGALRYREVLGLPVAESPLHPDPVDLVRVARSRILAGDPAEPLTPLYLRRPDAAEPHPPKRVTRP